MAAYEIRAARQTDRARILGMWLDLVDYHRALDPCFSPPAGIRDVLLDEISRGVGSDRCQILVAEVEDALVGFLFAEIERASISAESDPGTGWIHELWVEPTHRGFGLAAAMLERAEDRLRRRGCTRIAVRVESANEDGLRFWRHRRFRERARILERDD
jgi:GNAT superfamily N-acetyltransferase